MKRISVIKLNGLGHAGLIIIVYREVLILGLPDIYQKQIVY